MVERSTDPSLHVRRWAREHAETHIDEFVFSNPYVRLSTTNVPTMPSDACPGIVHNVSYVPAL